MTPVFEQVGAPDSVEPLCLLVIWVTGGLLFDGQGRGFVLPRQPGHGERGGGEGRVADRVVIVGDSISL